ncbi:Imm59 family immunity protein [Enterococcus sp. LJL51]|uniref:Imm59 family immunity protein n=1 Tax=Enterococcus sp. LJL51 TaxID=3416656 RepID=UPI003CEDD63B
MKKNELLKYSSKRGTNRVKLYEDRLPREYEVGIIYNRELEKWTVYVSGERAAITSSNDYSSAEEAEGVFLKKAELAKKVFGE